MLTTRLSEFIDSSLLVFDKSFSSYKRITLYGDVIHCGIQVIHLIQLNLIELNFPITLIYNAAI